MANRERALGQQRGRYEVAKQQRVMTEPKLPALRLQVARKYKIKFYFFSTACIGVTCRIWRHEGCAGVSTELVFHVAAGRSLLPSYGLGFVRGIIQHCWRG